MKKIVYPILLLVLTACKGNQQTTNNEFAAIPVAETIADTIAQPEVDAITSATSKPNQVSFNGRIVLPPQRQATIALTMGGIVKKASLLPGQWVAANSVIATLENPEFITLQQTYLDSHAQTEYLLAEYERQKNLSAEQAASQKKFQQSKADFLSMKSRQDAAAAQLSLLGVQTEALLKNGIQPLLEVKAPISGYAANVAINIGKYKRNKNFAILGISLDIDKKAWETAISKDSLNWEQVCDFTGLSSETAKQYAILTLPTNILISPTGRILARDIKGEALTNKLKELLKTEEKKWTTTRRVSSQTRDTFT